MKTSAKIFATVLLTALCVSAVMPCFAHEHSLGARNDLQHISVLERFRSYSGARSPEGFSELFTIKPYSEVRQLPLISLSDGKTVVLIAASMPVADGMAVSFSLEGATQLSVKKIRNGEWEIQALPDKGTNTAALLVLKNGQVFRYPLIVAPVLPNDTDLSEQGFISYLRDKESSSPTANLDLNKDGKSDYLDDYIFTANYLAKKSVTGKNPDARKQRALHRTLSAPNAMPKPEPRKEYDGVFYGSPD